MVMQMVFQEFPRGGMYCNCFILKQGVHLADLPCGGCKFCTRVHENWKHFESNVDDVVPLAIRTVHIADDADVQSASSSTDVGSTKDVDEQSTSWLPQYTPEQLWKKQVADQDLGKLIVWLEDKVTPTTQDLYLSSPGVKRFWLSNQSYGTHPQNYHHINHRGHQGEMHSHSMVENLLTC